MGCGSAPRLQACSRVPAENKSTILDDSFIRHYIDDVLRSLRTQYLIDLLKSYSRIELKFLAKVWTCSHQPPL